MRPYFLFLLCFVLPAAGCRREPVVVKRAFYFWKSASGWVSTGEEQIRDSLQAHKLYLKLFEVDTDPMLGAVPVAKTRLWSLPSVPDSLRARSELVPVIFINNEVLTPLSAMGIDSLADNIQFLTRKCLDRLRAETWRITELQVDCDWSAGNRETYFSLLRAIRRKWGKTLSCTLRFYPYKYRDRMGIPPVDRVMLMCYNLLNPLSNPDRNTILEVGELKGYLDRRRAYPLPFDIALPAYSRMQLYQNGRFVKAIHSDEAAILSLLRQSKPYWYAVTADTVLDDTYLRKGDVIKYETVSPGQLAALTTLLEEKLAPSDTITIALFHLDQYNLNQYPYESLEAAYRTFAP